MLSVPFLSLGFTFGQLHETIICVDAPTLSKLLTLPATDRAELAMALWESLSEAEREDEFALSDQQAAELDRRWAEHLKNPHSALLWPEVRRRLLGNR